MLIIVYVHVERLALAAIISHYADIFKAEFSKQCQHAYIAFVGVYAECVDAMLYGVFCGISH